VTWNVWKANPPPPFVVDVNSSQLGQSALQSWTRLAVAAVTALYPSSNEWDVPALRLDVQPTCVPAPVLPWGSVARSRHMPGTYSMFVEDRRFLALLRHPERLAETGCGAVTEPNISIYEQSPRWEVLHATGIKRRVARTWQDAGIPVFVDLNVPARHRDLCMLGVPRGYRAFASRGYSRRPEDLVEEYEYATAWAGGEPLFLVVGGAPRIEALCRELPGAVFAPDHRRELHGARVTQTLRDAP
jgi:hypothetical protein